MIIPEHYMEIYEWAKTQKRVTTYTIGKAFGLTYKDSSWVYKNLRDDGVIGYGGYTCNAEGTGKGDGDGDE